MLRKKGSARIYDITDPLLVGSGIYRIMKLDQNAVFSVLYYEGGNMNYMVKRFTLENCPMTSDFWLITDHPESILYEVFVGDDAKALMEYQVGREVQKEEIDLTEIAEIKSYKALGSKFTAKKVKRISRISPEISAETENEEPTSLSETMDLFE